MEGARKSAVGQEVRGKGKRRERAERERGLNPGVDAARGPQQKRFSKGAPNAKFERALHQGSHGHSHGYSVTSHNAGAAGACGISIVAPRGLGHKAWLQGSLAT